MKTSSHNGFGTKLLFHGAAGPGLVKATVWVMACYIPLFPRSTWLIRPRGIKEESISGGTSTTHYTEFLERRKTPFGRILCILGWLVPWWRCGSDDLGLCYSRPTQRLEQDLGRGSAGPRSPGLGGGDVGVAGLAPRPLVQTGAQGVRAGHWRAPRTYSVICGGLNQDLRVDLKPAANTVTLDQRNSAPIN